MERSLSVLLPVYNVQSSLRGSVERVLDVAADLTDRFQVLIIDDASTDHTAEVAHELSIHYRQVSWLQNAQRSGLPQIIRTGLDRTAGNIVCLHEGHGPVDVADLRRLWQLRNDENLVLARHCRKTHGTRDAWLQRLTGRAAEVTAGSGFQMLRRDAVHGLGDNVPLTATQQSIRFRRDGAAVRTVDLPARPNFLAHLKQLAWGE